MPTTHNLGFPRIGRERELKWALEAYWRGEKTLESLEETSRTLRLRHWEIQAAAGLDLIPVGDFSWYDQVLDTTTLLGAIPKRFAWKGGEVDPDTYFRMARGRAPSGPAAAACEMTKWFDTNYHYIVPELTPDQPFVLSSGRLFDQVREAREAGYRVKPVLLGPLSWLWLGKTLGEDWDRLTRLDELVSIYGDILQRLVALGVEWIQIDEPILGLDLPQAWRTAFESAYSRLHAAPGKILLTTYFGPLRENLNLATRLPVDGLHLDGIRAAGEIPMAADLINGYKVLSVGLVDGRNIWRTDLDAALARLTPLHERLGQRLWIAPSCSLLHSPVDLSTETRLDPELKSWLAFARQKLDELAVLKRALEEGADAVAAELTACRQALSSRRTSPRIHRPEVAKRLAGIRPDMGRRQAPYAERAQAQQERLKLPLFPTTTIGSFPQTPEIRRQRREFRQGRIDRRAYAEFLRAEIKRVVEKQETYGLDVLVHGEPERNDMVEYFGEHLEGFAFTANGWVQSYGSRCVKPPIIYGDVERPAPMTLDWTRFAQSLTSKPMKGMLTGPVTILQWSFVRDDQPRADTCRQIALALRDEVLDLEAADIAVIQIDEPALREGLPLRRSDWQGYLDWAVEAFHLTAGGVRNDTQIHTHMCYSEFNAIIEAVAALDADVVTIEAARSRMELLDAFERFRYPNAIGPGIYDIHSPNIPSVEEMLDLLKRALAFIPADRLWVNPDCGLKTRTWPEVDAAMTNMVQAARQLRAERLSDSRGP